MPDSSLASQPDPWWSVTLDPGARADASAARLTDAGGTPLVNAPHDAGRQALDYGTYLGLDRLLSAQRPASAVPDERAFIVTHQLFEVAFKLMVFDLGVLAHTFRALLEEEDAGQFEALALTPLPDERGPAPFWRPALTSAARLRHSARRVLPAVMTLLGRGEDDDVLFSSIEFGLFRDFLTPSSGFQTAQLRLIQRALAKGPLLDVRVFPGEVFGEHYGEAAPGCPMGHVALGDPLILRDDHERAFPGEDAPETEVARLDDLAHRVMGRLTSASPATEPPAVRRIHADDVDRAVRRVRATMGGGDDAEAVTRQFREDLEQAAAAENDRRADMTDARRGAQYLHGRGRRTCLAFTLDRLVATDAALHSPDTDSFLTVHRKTVRRHVADDSGTGGGGMPYLVTSQRFLFPLMPALVAFSDLGATGTDETRDRW